jgi:hypothetical protein
MDYNNGTHLLKYQWDFIHDPRVMLAWGQDEEEIAEVNENVFKFEPTFSIKQDFVKEISKKV